jgi:outer membrane receptor protein involved in Fe transport
MSFGTKSSIFLASSAAICIAAMPTPAAAQARSFDIPAQPAETGIPALGRQAEIQIAAARRFTKGLRTNEVRGTMTVKEALSKLLDGTGLTVRATGQRTYMVVPAPARSTAEGEPLAADAPEEQIVVTGSRIRGGPATSPVITISRAEAEKSGQTDLGQIIRDLPQNFAGGQNPTIVAAGQGGFTNVSGSSALNLRGLGPDASLTLFNGHRAAFDAVSQGIDISAIPLSAIERIDIVTDGASALYGSDAVAGVANVILRRRVDEVVTSVRIAGTTDGGGFTQQYNVVGGPSWSSGSLMAAADFQKANEITARQRSYTGNLPPDATLIPGQKQVSIVAAGRQILAEGIKFEIDGHYMHRSTERCITASVSPSCYGQGSVVSSTADSWSVSPSLEVELSGGWSLRFSGTYGESDTSIATRVFFNRAEVSLALPDYANELRSFEFGAEGRLFPLPGGDARLAIGGGVRTNKLTVDSRRVVGGIETPIDIFAETRKVTFGYGELSFPFVSPGNAVPFVNKFQLVGALRLEDHRGIDRVTTPKVGVVYSPLSGVDFKASWGKSFKVPTLYQTGQTSNAQLLPGFIFSPAPTSTSPVLYLFGGNPNLAPERATTLTTSLTVEPFEGLRAEVGYFHIRYRNRVAAPFSPITSALLPVYAAFVQLNPSAAEVNGAIAGISGVFENSSGQAFDPAGVAAILDNRLQNISLQSLSGMDAAVKYSHDFGDSGKMQLNGAVTYLDSARRITADLPLMAQSGLIFRPPHWRARLSGGWEKDNISITAVGSYIGPVKDDRFQPIVTVPSFVTFDTVLHLTTDRNRGLLGGMGFTVSIQNIFNERPSPIRFVDPAALRYDSINQSTFGRTFSLTLSKAW